MTQTRLNKGGEMNHLTWSTFTQTNFGGARTMVITLTD